MLAENRQSEELALRLIRYLAQKDQHAKVEILSLLLELADDATISWLTWLMDDYEKEPKNELHG
jgi:hypothetical protein